MAAANESPEHVRILRECPVCQQTYKDPKSLPCGHSVCISCCRLLAMDGIHVTCPVCRRPSSVPVNNLPLNYGLRDFVQHYVENRDTKPFSCVDCKRKTGDEDCWRCDDCRAIVCGSCCVRKHNGHQLQEIKPLVDEKNVKLIEWRNWFQRIKDDFDNRWLEMQINQVILLEDAKNASTLVVKIHRRIEMATERLQQELDEFGKRFHEANAARFVVNELNCHPGGSANFENELSLLQQKQQLLAKTKNEMLDISRKFSKVLLRIVHEFGEICNRLPDVGEEETSPQLMREQEPSDRPRLLEQYFQIVREAGNAVSDSPTFRRVVTPVEIVVPAGTSTPFRRVRQEMAINIGENSNSQQPVVRPSDSVQSTGYNPLSERYTDSFRERLNRYTTCVQGTNQNNLTTNKNN